MTGVVLFVMALVVLSYREVVTVYTRAGGSYVVARDNFGPRVGTDRRGRAADRLCRHGGGPGRRGHRGGGLGDPGHRPPELITVISVAIVLVMCYGNLRGIREAGRAFAVPTYLFSGSVIMMIIVGPTGRSSARCRSATWPLPGAVHRASTPAALIAFGLIFVLLRAFANGGSSLTGIEAVSNAVSAFRPPEGLNARKVLVIEG